jgi:NAD kinase
MAAPDKIVVVTRPTPFEELVRRFNTEGQARFYVEHQGGDFEAYKSAHEAFERARDTLKASLPRGVRVQWIDRAFLPTFLFGPQDLVVVLGPDGLVVNVAKYLKGQAVLAFNPDRSRIDGVLLPFPVGWASQAFEALARDALSERQVTMAEARLNDGQSILAVNDLFLGRKTHVSARYRIRHGDRAEDQSSSGIIVSTGAGSTGWYRSVLAGACGVVTGQQGEDVPEVTALRDRYAFDWSDRRLVFAVREPFASKTSGATIVTGWVTPESPLEVTSQMPDGGVIFSDGVEEDFLSFSAGTTARIGPAERTLRLIVRRWRAAQGPNGSAGKPRSAASRW